MNTNMLISLAGKLAREIEFICQSVVITDEDILPIREYAPLIFDKITESARTDNLEVQLGLLCEARDACVAIDQILILMYSTNIISLETSRKIRNAYASIGRNLTTRSSSIKKKLSVKK